MQLEFCDADIDAVSKRVPQVDADCLRDIEFLMKGMFGHVRKVRVVGNHPKLRHNDSQGHGNRPLLFASKHINPNSKDPEDAAMQLANEAIILSTLNHENVIKLQAVCSGSFSKSFAKHPRGYFLLFDILDDTLQNRLAQWRHEKYKVPRLCSSIYKKITKHLPLKRPAVERIERCQEMYSRAQDASVIGITRGLAYLHSKQIVWRDLKPANIGYYRKNDGRSASWTVKLIDFGMAKRVKDCVRGECCGSLAYMAPETMRGEQFTPQADIFSLAVVVSEICSLRIPYPKSRKEYKRMGDMQRFDAIRKEVEEEGLQPMDDLEKNIHCPKLRFLIHECWSSPADRPNSAEIATRLNGILCPILYNGDSPAKLNLDATHTTDDDQIEEKIPVHSHFTHY